MTNLELRLLNALIGMVQQHCQGTHNDPEIVTTDAISSNEDATFLLMQEGYLRQAKPGKEWYLWTEKTRHLFKAYDKLPHHLQ